MLTINGLRKFYFLPLFHDMRCKAPRITEIIRSHYNRDPLNGDVYIFMYMETLEEAKNYIRFLYAQVQELKERDVYMRTALDEIKTELKEAREIAKSEQESRAKLMESFVSLTGDLKDANTKIVELTRQLETKSDRLKVASKNQYGTSKSQK